MNFGNGGDRENEKCKKLAELEKIIGYKFKSFEYLTTALSHKSYVNSKNISKSASYERLEFLGDSVLSLLITEYLYKKYPDKSEGQLTKMRSHWISRSIFNKISMDIGLGNYLLLSRGEEKTGGRKKSSILCDVFESLTGAVFLDGGFNEAKRVIEKIFFDKVDVWEEFTQITNSKSEILEYVQRNKLGKIDYQVVKESGPEHKKFFKVNVLIDGLPKGAGEGKTKKEAEQMAAYTALLEISDAKQETSDEG